MSINRAPFNALVDDDGSNTVGSVWNKSAIQTVLLDPIDALPAVGGAWTAYTPTWRSAGSVNPVIGNGTLAGWSKTMGHTCHLLIQVLMGSTTTYGDNFFVFGLPFPEARLGALYAATAALVGGGALPGATGYPSGPSAIYLVTPAGGLVGPTVPITWAAGQQITIRATYEV